MTVARIVLESLSVFTIGLRRCTPERSRENEIKTYYVLLRAFCMFEQYTFKRTGGKKIDYLKKKNELRFL